MNIGHVIFKRIQRLQGGEADVGPSMRFARSEHPPRQMSTWADYFEMLLNERDVQEKERLKRELGLEIDPDMAWNPPTERPPDEGQRERFQGGEYDVRGKEPPFAEGGKWWWEKADEQRAKEIAAEDLGERQASITEDMTPGERQEVMTEDPRNWSDSVREKIGAANEKAATDDEQGHARGTSNVNNMGLRLFMAGQGLHRKKRKL